ncbi:thioredoxin family protein [Nocardioides daphniae]|uniref:Thioredoxin n=1 Tax=Nocardioides daphniae TaxID=402297 RepID=A0A4P7U887_9ACTN|nr:thioredoxin family protein [Nocardioides daphniae]QCC76383.1 thioredoxin [Nocardioides daphniae]GGD07383.1 hypothetical protein GCM10007231_02590 [Nocardioides daphniae]
MTTGQWVLLASVVLAVVFGLWRAATDGRFRGTHQVRGVQQVDVAGSADATVDATSGATADAPSPGTAADSVVAGTPYADRLGEKGTLLQFSSAFCAPCRVTRRTLEEVAAVVPGVAHVEVDAESHLDLVRRVNVMRTPTTLVLDAAGREVTRAAGAPTKQQVLSALALLD